MDRSGVCGTTVVLVLTLLLAGCGKAGPDPALATSEPEPPRPGEATEFLLAMASGDDLTLLYVERVLSAHGIWSSTQGSIGWGTVVRAVQRADAERWLRKEEGLRGYVEWPGSPRTDTVPTTEAPTTSETVDAEYAEALTRYPASTTVGRMLRSTEARGEVGSASGLHVETATWNERPFVTRSLKPAKALVGVLRMRDKPFGSYDVHVVLGTDE